MKKYTLTIIYNDKTGDMDSLTENVEELDSYPISVTASAKGMEQIDEAGLIKELCVPFPGVCIGES